MGCSGAQGLDREVLLALISFGNSDEGGSRLFAEQIALLFQCS